ncbi:CHASE2 domain-containing protein [Mesorhizobium liriopis]|uniref:CHASE2 domain-containing protein n=1 Tax=Mesorhizobium liriopis TaxID=2953882 RepID=UPI003EB7B849
MPGGGGRDIAARNRRLGIVFLTVVASLGAGLLPLAGPFKLIEARLFDYLSTFHPPARPANGPVIVAIDEPSFSELNLQWPWPRGLHAELIEALRAAGAEAIGVDIIFAEPSASAEGDKALAAATGPDVVLAGDETVIRTPQADQLVRTEPMPLLLEKGATVGLASVTLDNDGTLRRLPSLDDGFAATLLRTIGETPDIPEGALLQSFGAARSYPTVSYYQALDPENFLPPGFFRGRTVIVGLSLQASADAQGGADSFATSQTVRDGRLLAGAEVQATVLDNLRHGLFITPASTLVSLAATLGMACLGGLLVWRGTGWQTILLASLGVLGLFAGSYLFLRFGRIYAPPVAPALAFLFVASAQGVRDYAAERRLRRGITRAFSQYVSPVIVERLARDPERLKLGGERRTLSILFCDVRGFTTIAERMKNDPEALTRLINRLLNPLSAVVIAHGGTIDKYIGDALMAFWNAPLDDPDHALHAVQAGLAMNDALEALNAELAAEAAAKGEEPLSLRIGVGVNTGDCVVGNMGSDMRFDYSALGDAVNLAARLEGETKNFGVELLVGEETARHIRDRLPLAPLDRIKVKGKLEPVEVSTVLAGADPETLEAHRTLLEDFWSGRLDPEDPRLFLLSTRLPALDAHYEQLARRSRLTVD